MTAEPHQKMQCRYLKASGEPCRGLALRGQLYCFTHGRDLRRYANTSGTPVHIHVPRLDNRADIQQLLTDVARAVASATIDHAAARLLLALARLASSQLPPSRPLRSSQPGEEQSQPAPVEEVVSGPNGEELAPEAPYREDAGKPAREWSFAEYLYHKTNPGNEDKPLPEEGYGNRLATAVAARSQQPAASQPAQPTPSPLILDNLQSAAEIPQYQSTTQHNPINPKRIATPPHTSLPQSSETRSTTTSPLRAAPIPSYPGSSKRNPAKTARASWTLRT